MTKAIPWPLRVGIWEYMAKTKVVEKEETVAFGESLNRTGFV